MCLCSQPLLSTAQNSDQGDLVSDPVLLLPWNMILHKLFWPLRDSDSSSKTQCEYFPCRLVWRIRNKIYKRPGLAQSLRHVRESTRSNCHCLGLSGWLSTSHYPFCQVTSVSFLGKSKTFILSTANTY